MWRGFLPYYSRAAPNAVITMVTLDKLRQIYRILFLPPIEWYFYKSFLQTTTIIIKSYTILFYIFVIFFIINTRLRCHLQCREKTIDLCKLNSFLAICRLILRAWRWRYISLKYCGACKKIYSSIISESLSYY